jgi:glycosyltransferase involved in cell wall biosynthesis
MERLALSAADLVYVTTPALEAKVRETYRKPVVLVPNWVDIPEGGPRAGAEGSTGGARDPNLVLYAGRLHWTKGLDVLLRAFARVRSALPSARLEILGEGEERERLEALAASLGAASPGAGSRDAGSPGVVGVTFRGSLPNRDAIREMGRTAVFVLPTRTMEGHPKALLEAMATGAACVATDVPGNRDLIVDGESGLLVPPSDEEALAGALVRLLSDRALRERLGGAAREATARFGFTEIVARDVRILLQLGDDAARGGS